MTTPTPTDDPDRDVALPAPRPEAQIVIARLSVIVIMGGKPHVAPTQLYVPTLTVPGRVIIP